MSDNLPPEVPRSTSPTDESAANASMNAGHRIFDASPMPDDPRSSKTRNIVAWTVVALGTAAIVSVTLLVSSGGKEDNDPQMNGSMAELQGKYTIGASALMEAADPEGKSREQLIRAVNTDSGSYSDRLRNLVLIADLKEGDGAHKILEKIAESIEREDDLAGREGRDSAVTETDEENLRILRKLYRQDVVPSESVKELSGEERQALVANMGWFGELALAPAGGSEEQRKAVVSGAQSVFLGVVAGFMVLLAAGALGLVGLVLTAMYVVNGSMTAQFRQGRLDHRLYIETFAIWLVLTFLGQIVADLAASFLPRSIQLLPILCVFFGSLLVLAWPVICGAKFSDVCRDIGWSLPKPTWATPLYGVAGYLMALPMVAVGLMVTLILMSIVSLFAPSEASAPTHPIFAELTEGHPLLVLQVFLLGSVAAPIVEETMFRGVLYRNLRDASRSRKLLASVVFSAILSSFIFAAIHPQGVVTIPALMSLAIAFALARELLDSLVPSMIMHGVSNALVMTLGLSLFG